MGNNYKTSFGNFSKDPEKSLVEVKIPREIPDGVYICTETVILGHAFVFIVSNKKMIAYTYGRYGETSSEGVLFRYYDELCKDYIMKELYRFNANVYKIIDVLPCTVQGILDQVWNSSNLPPKTQMPDSINSGRIIDEYKLFSRNCTTVTCDAIRKSGSQVFLDYEFICKYDTDAIYDDISSCYSFELNRYFFDPEDLENYLESKSKNSDSVVKNYRKTIRNLIPNIKGYKYESIKEIYRSSIGLS